MWRRGVDRGEIRKEIDGEIVLDLVYGPMVFRLLAGHGSLNDHESEAMIEAIFGGLRQPGYHCSSKDENKPRNILSPLKGRRRLNTELQVQYQNLPNANKTDAIFDSMRRSGLGRFTRPA